MAITSAKFRDFSGQLIMACFGMIAVARFSETGLWFFLLTAFRDFYASFLFSRRQASSAGSTATMTVVAYVSSALPLCYFSTEPGLSIHLGLAVTLLSTLGFVLVGLATIDLGSSLGVAPALRGARQVEGIYRIFSHPMYLGYAIAEVGFVIANPMNWPIFGVSMALYLWRAVVENRIVSQAPNWN